MAWTTPRTWTVGETPTAAVFNTHVRDNLNFLYSPPSCRVYNSANLSTTSGVSFTVTLNSERWDTDTMHDTGSNTERIKATTAGRYLFVAQIEFAANATGYRQLAIQHSAAAVNVALAVESGPTASLATVLNAATFYPMTATEYVYVVTHQTSGGALNVVYDAGSAPEFMAHWVGEG